MTDDKYKKALLRIYKIVQHEMKDWMMPEDSVDELRDAMKEAKGVLYSSRTRD